MWTIAKKEILSLLSGPRFSVVLVISLLVAMLSMFFGYENYRLETDLRDTGTAIGYDRLKTSKDLSDEGSWAYREPGKLSILASGITGHLGRVGRMKRGISYPMDSSPFSQNPSLSLFGELDFAFLIIFIFPLFAILFTYDSISGEKENGTLKYILANPVTRPAVLTGKLLGPVILLAAIFLTTLLFSLFILMILWNVTFSSSEWVRICIYALLAILYILVFTLLGTAVSAFTQRRFTSLLVLLMLWVMSTVLIPSLAMQVSTSVTRPMMKAEFNNRFSAIMDDEQYQINYELDKYLNDNNVTQEMWNEEKIWERVMKISEEDQRAAYTALIKDFNNSQNYAYSNYSTFALLSPSAVLKNALAFITDTGPRYLERMADSRRLYENQQFEFAWNSVIDPTDEGGQRSSLNFSPDENGILRAAFNEGNINIDNDLTGMPSFTMVGRSLATAIQAVLPNAIAMLLLMTIFTLTAFIKFLKYDVR